MCFQVKTLISPIKFYLSRQHWVQWSVDRRSSREVPLLRRCIRLLADLMVSSSRLKKQRQKFEGLDLNEAQVRHSQSTPLLIKNCLVGPDAAWQSSFYLYLISLAYINEDQLSETFHCTAVIISLTKNEGRRMTQFTTISVLLGVVFVALASAQVPIPSRPDGYGVGGPADAHVVVEMFLDPLCPGCKAAWPTVLQVIQAYDTRIHVRIHTFPLPYHTNSFVVSQGLHVVANATNRNLDTIFQYATKVFDNQQIWSNDGTKAMTMPQIVDSLASFVDRLGLVPKATFVAGMASDEINDETRISWKYACSRGNWHDRSQTSL